MSAGETDGDNGRKPGATGGEPRTHAFDFLGVRRLIADNDPPSTWLPRQRPWQRERWSHRSSRPLYE
jgi:hypothetical protein